MLGWMSSLVDAYLLHSDEMLSKVPKWARTQCQVVGDLFADAVATSITGLPHWPPLSGNQSAAMTAEESVPVVGLLPGSKDAKLAIGVPYFIAVAEHLHQRLEGHVRFVLPLAPTVSLDVLARHADPCLNPLIARFKWAAGNLVLNQSKEIQPDSMKQFEDRGAKESPQFLKDGPVGELLTKGQVHIEIWQQFPPYTVYQQCNLCLTTVGTNTAELGSLGIPMFIVLPTHALEMFKGATGGVVGLLAAVPGWIGDTVAHLVNLALLKTAGFISWPNRWAGEEVVPELIGNIEPVEVAAMAAEYLNAPSRLHSMHQRLISLRQKRPSFTGQLGAAHTIACTVEQMLRS
jgi:hypothetical protein